MAVVTMAIMNDIIIAGTTIATGIAYAINSGIVNWFADVNNPLCTYGTKIRSPCSGFFPVLPSLEQGRTGKNNKAAVPLSNDCPLVKELTHQLSFQKQHKALFLFLAFPFSPFNSALNTGVQSYLMQQPDEPGTSFSQEEHNARQK